MGIRDPRPYAKALLGQPYCYGTRGWRMTAANIAAKKKQYEKKDPKYIPYEGGVNPKNIGTDCIGLVCYACSIPDTKGGPMGPSDMGMAYYQAKNGKEGNAFMDALSAGGARSAWGAKPISSIPIPEPTKTHPGVAVFIKDSHIGLYLGNGEVIESTPARVQITKLNARRTNTGGSAKWDAWAYVPEKWLTWAESYFGETAIPVGDYVPRLGDLVRIKSDAWHYYPGSVLIDISFKTGDLHKVTQITSGGKDVYIGGAKCVLLGKRVNPASNKESDGINTWVDEKCLELVQPAKAAAASSTADGAAMDIAS